MDAIKFVCALMIVFLTNYTVKAFQDEEEKQLSIEPLGFFQLELFNDDEFKTAPDFRVRRARIGVRGNYRKHIGYQILGGFVESPNRRPELVNLFADFKLHELFQVRAGQFVVPFGVEGPTGIYLNPAIERTQVVRSVNTYNLFRDIGVRISGEKDFFSYAISWTNGSGANQIQNFGARDLHGRVQFAFLEDFRVGASGNYGFRDTEDMLFRSGVDFSYVSPLLHFRSEFQYRNEKNEGFTEELMGGYLFGAVHLHRNWQILLRYEYLEFLTENRNFTALMLGLNYYFREYSRIAVNYEISNEENLLTFQLQFTL